MADDDSRNDDVHFESDGAIDPERAAGNGDDGYARDDAGNIIRNKDGSPRKKRGRKPGQRNGRKSSGNKAAKNSGLGVEKILLSLHAMGAAAMRCPEIALDESEAKALAESIMTVQSFYDFEASAEIVAWCNLVAVMIATYGPRIYLIKERKREEKSSKKNDEKKNNVLDFITTPPNANP